MDGLRVFQLSSFRNICFLLSVGMLNLASVPANAAIIDVSAPITNLTIGEHVYVDFNILGLTGAIGDSLSAFDLDILFDDSVFSFTGFDFTDPVLGNNQLDLPEIGAFSFYGNVFDPGNGVLDVYGVSGNSDLVLDADQANDFRFLGLTFLAIAETSSSGISINLTDPYLLVLDSDFGDLDISYAPAQVDIAVSSSAPSTPVPEPSTLLLLTMGMPFLSSRIRKRFVRQRGKKE